MKTFLSLVALCFIISASAAQNVVIRAGHVVDVESSTIRDNQVILVTDGIISAIGEDVDIPADARVVDLSDSYVLPGLIESHTHMALTRQARRDFGAYYFTTLLEPTPYRAIQGVTNSRSMLETGFTTIRDVGNAGNYADTDLRRAIEEGWIPGPKIINSGRLIAPFGGQFHLQPEKPDLAEPEYFFADTP
ncbi:MAG: amidohydrolase family protein, partial [Bacteroidetes bacterium]|nr:amidohydrolase family protein [Bacteroidota bacterium]